MLSLVVLFVTRWALTVVGTIPISVYSISLILSDSFVVEVNNKFTINLSLYVMSSLILAVREDYICWWEF